MNVLSVGTDRGIFKEGSAVRGRMAECGRLFDELHIVVFATMSHGAAPQQIAPNVWVYPTQSRSRWLYMFDAVALGKKIVLKKRMVPTDAKADWMVTAQDPFETGVVGSRLAHVLKIPLQIQIHTDFLSPYFASKSLLNSVRLFIARRTLPRADRIRVVSERIKMSLQKAGYTLKTEPIVLPIIVNAEKITSAPASVDIRKKYPEFGRIVLMASRLEPEKNIPMAIRAFKRVVEKVPEAGLVIVGKGSEENQLIQLIMSEGLGKNVVLEPWCDDLIPYYKTADVFLSTSLYEGYGLTLVEAALAGCPIVTSDVGVVGYELPTTTCGVFPVDDGQKLVEALANVLTDETQRVRMANEARIAIERSLIPKDEYMARYKAAVEGNTFPQQGF